MFKDLLSTAKDNFAAHQREEEIRNLDIDPEEYVMLRDDKSPMAVGLLKAILENLKIPYWEVDEGTLRIVRISETPSVRKNWALAMTSDTRRFHLKVYRDFDGELDEIDLKSSRGIRAAIFFVEKTIQDIGERKIREAEVNRLTALEEERRRQEEVIARIIRTVEQINEKNRSIYSKELSASRLGDELLISANEYIAHKVATMIQAQISLPAGNDVISVKEKFQGKLFKIIDNVPCEFDEENALINVSNKFIKNCVEGRNLVLPRCAQVQYIPETCGILLNYSDQPGGVGSHHDQIEGFSPRTKESSPGFIAHRVRVKVATPQQPQPINSLADTLSEVERILAEVESLDASTKSDMAKISVLSIYSEVSKFKDLMESIDGVLSAITENVNLIVWWDGKYSTK